MNVIARLEFELAYYASAVHRFNHYTTRTPPPEFSVASLKFTIYLNPHERCLIYLLFLYSLIILLFTCLCVTAVSLSFRLLSRLGSGAVKHNDYISADEEDPFPSDCPVYDTKQSDGDATVMLEFWGMQSAPSSPSLPGPLWSEVVTPDRVLSMG